MDEQHLVDLLLDRVERVERGHRLLEDHRDPVAAHPPQHGLAAPEELLAVEADAAARDGARAGRAGAAGSRARSPTCPSRSRPTSAERLAAIGCRSEIAAHRPRTGAARRVEATTDRSRDAQERARLAVTAVFRGSKASRTASPMKTRRLSITREHEEAGDAEPRRLEVGLALGEDLAERRRARRQAEAEEVERGQRGDRAVQDERQEGQRRHHRVRQHVAEHDDARCRTPSARAART